jgi:tetratricopeptide (TPR) repeat protein
MNRLFLTGLLLIVCTRLFAFSGDIDSLKKKLNTAPNDTVKASLYTQLAQQYMKYVAVQDQHLKERYQEIAINYTLAAIHQYARLDDSTGLRVSYDDLSKIYYDQKKFTQAKWFILQSNTLARQQNDVTNIIASLITLAHIKMDIHDYDLAKGDLKEALSLSAQNCFSGQQSQVLYTIASLYSKTNNKAQAQAFLRRYAVMKDSMRRDSQMRRLAKVQLRKKKFYVINNILNYRNNTQTILL